MKTKQEVMLHVKTIVKKYHNLKYVDPNDLDKDLVAYAEPLDIQYMLSHMSRNECVKELSEYHDPKYEPLAQALMECIDMHPDIIGAFVTGSHANSHIAKLNDTVIQLIDYTASLIGILETHPDLVCEL